jgi:hypothetical protein
VFGVNPGHNPQLAQAAVSEHEELCAEARTLLDSADNSVLSDLMRAQALATLAVVEIISELRDELKPTKGKD